MSDLADVVRPERDHFTRIAPGWSQFGAPLRPSPEDTAVVQRHASALRGGNHAVLLGLTPEIVACEWPHGVRLTAVDHSTAMMRSLWAPEGERASLKAALIGDWCALPLASASIDLIAGDGCYVVLPQPHGFDAFSREVHRVLRVDGRFLIRVFLRPSNAETVADITRDFIADRIESVHVLKLRLWAALSGHGGTGTLLDDVWRAWRAMSEQHRVDRERPGWSEAEIGTIEGYRGMSARYSVPTLAEFRHRIAPLFHEHGCDWGAYPGADRCPTFVLAKRSTRA